MAVGVVAAAEPTISTFAGGGAAVPGDGGAATDAQLDRPSSIAFDRSGNLYIAEGADSFNACRIRRVSPTGIITTFAGNGGRGTQGENVPATSVSVCAYALTVDAAGNLYVGEHSRIRRITPSGMISTIAGTGTWGFSGDGGPANRAQVGVIQDLAVDSAGRLYIVDNVSMRIRRIDAGGTIRTIAGNGGPQASGDGGPALTAGMSPRALVVDAAGSVYFSDNSNGTIRRLSTAGVVSRVAGKGPFRVDPLAVNSDMYFPWGLALDGGGNLFVANQSNLVHMITPAGILKVVAGDYNDSTFSPYGAWWGFGGDGGPATAAMLWEPQDVALDAAGNVYVADTRNNRVRRITPVAAPRVPGGVDAFRPVQPYAAATYNVALATGDFNGDRREDVAIISGSWTGAAADPASDYSILVYLQQAGGTLGAPSRYVFPAMRSVGRLLAADLNRDGSSDLIWPSEVGLNVVLGGPTGLRAGPLLQGETNAEVPGDFVVGDMDLDGRLDVVAWMSGRSVGGTAPTDLAGLTIFYGDGQGGAARRRFLRQSIPGGRLAWMDVDRDGRSDLISTWAPDVNESGVAVFAHDGVDAFRAPQLVRSGRGGFNTGGIATGDFDGDGAPEIVLAKSENAPHAELALLKRMPSGTLRFDRSWRTYDLPADLAGRDIDGDGADDLLVLHSGWSSIGYYHQLPGLAPSALDAEVKYAVRTSNLLFGGLGTADLNGDGCLDVAFSDNNNGLQVLYSTGCLRTPGAVAPLLTPRTTSTVGSRVDPAFGASGAADSVTRVLGMRRVVVAVRRMAAAMRVGTAQHSAAVIAGGSALMLLLASAVFFMRIRRR